MSAICLCLLFCKTLEFAKEKAEIRREKNGTLQSEGKGRQRST